MLVMKMEEKIKQNQGGFGVGDTMKMAWDVGSINDEKKSCDEVKNFPVILLKAKSPSAKGAYCHPDSSLSTLWKDGVAVLDCGSGNK